MLVLCSENAVHPHHPARIKLRLEHTIPGCDWLIGSLGGLLVRLYGDKLWLSADPFKMVRLMGKHAIDMVANSSQFRCGYAAPGR